MDFEKLIAQREGKAKVSEPEQAIPSQPQAKPGRKPNATSKRQGWKAATFYVRPETKARLERLLMERKLAGAAGAADQSEAVEEALQTWLAQHEPQPS
ncbi:hypothetical protein FB106_12019 [Synechococcus sp. Ace-Pa]|uniref:fructosamine kinase family protein n=1 Tax=Synechococcus sp. Ace-Pa TaxID=2572902 RepID=UPI0011A55AFB|nr:fructosamine kinase family protein [Synechococcus sp. Ace-Pa]MCT4364777.1 hypothetical protein [Candidatus Regnicoccus frigidus MAG-AL1]TWB87684.1 hypothetical protein FB106_12019 [Synechococcus sp. Ace-Pa]